MTALQPIKNHLVCPCVTLPSGQSCNVMSEALLSTVRDCRQTGNTSTESEESERLWLSSDNPDPGGYTWTDP